MKRYIFAFLVGIIGCPAVAQTQTADLTCDDGTRLKRVLSTVMRAERRAFGLRGPETVLEVWSETRTQDWTSVQTYTQWHVMHHCDG